MPTQEASVDRRHRSARPPAGVESLLSGLSPLNGTAPNDYLPQPHPFGCREARRAARRASTALEVGGAQRAERASTDGCQRRSASCSEGAAAEREGFEPSGGVGDDFKRHATLHANALKFCLKWFGSLSPLVPMSRRQSSAVRRSLGSGWAAMSRSHATNLADYRAQSAGHGGPAHKN